MGAVMPIVSVGLGVVSSLGAASAQRKQADSQAKSLEQQTMIQRDQLALSTQQLEAQKESAKFLAERERTVNQAQVDQARLLSQQNEQRQQLGYMAAENQIKEQKSQVQNVVAQILGQAATENTQMLAQDANQLEQLAEVISQTSGMDKQAVAKFLGMSGGKASNASGQAQTKQAMGLDAVEAYQRGMSNSDAAARQVGYNTQASSEAAALQERYGNLAEAFGLQNLDFQKQMDANANQTGVSDIYYTGERNLAGIEAQKYATIGAANMSQANANFNARNNSVATQAQLSSINQSRPGLLSMANTLGQGFNALNQLGVFGMNKPQPIVQPSLAPGYSVYQGGVTMTPFGSNAMPTPNASALNNSSTLGGMFN